MNSYWPGPLPEPSVRTLDDMRCVLANPDQSGNTPLYYMYRDLALTAGDRAYLREQNVRFDITVIPPGTAGSTSRPEAATTRRAPRASINPGSTRIKPRVPACGIDDGRTPEDFVPRESSAAG